MTFRSSKYLRKGGIDTASKEKITELIRMFLTYKIATELPGKFIKEINEEEYQKFFKSNLIVKSGKEISFNEFKLAFERKVIDSEKETIERIVNAVTEKMPSLEKLSDAEIDRMITILNTPEGYAIREMIALLLENIEDILDGRAEEIGLSCFDLVIEVVDLNKKIDAPKISVVEMN